MKLTTALLATTLLTAPLAVHAEDPHAMPGMKMSGAPMSEASKAYDAVNMKMHKDMTMEFTGDADVDFVKGMTPHHQGAIDMAQVVLKYGKDPDIRKLAEGIIKAQETEISFMKEWLAKHSK